jgi:hypothetical protein
MNRPRRLDAETVQSLLTDSEPWLSCDDCFELVDAAVEAAVATGTALTPEFRVHLGACAVCREEAIVLAEVVAEHHGMTPGAAVERLHIAMRPPGREQDFLPPTP